jgi:hypothetical protein
MMDKPMSEEEEAESTHEEVLPATETMSPLWLVILDWTAASKYQRS